MKLTEQWGEILAGLPRGWDSASLALTVEDESDAERVARILGSAVRERSDPVLGLVVERGRLGVAPSAELMRRVLARLDNEGIRGQLAVLDEGDGAGPRVGLAAQWDALLASLPPDWSHLYAELELDSTDFVERGALLMAPTNPGLFGGPRGLRFRAARTLGYGVAAEMARRCLERLDRERITGTLRLLRVVSDDHPVGTQGPVWHIDGRTV